MFKKISYKDLKEKMKATEKQVTRLLEKLKTLFLINELFPEEVDDFIDNFELDESDKEYLKNIDIKIHY